ncbi:MAG: beta-eliminating lyase-related protein, partial [Bryobacteraceae bacterium]
RAHALGLRVHLDGARIFNAAVACGHSVRELCEPADTVMFCLSKVLGAPVGSMLAGPRDLIAQARLYRKRLGGGMRQAGVLAAAGLVALEQTPPKLAEDHANARLLAEGLANLRGVRVEPAVPPTNIVIFDIAATGVPAAELSARLKQRGVLINPISPTALRAVTHYDVSRADCRRALEQIAAALSAH